MAENEYTLGGIIGGVVSTVLFVDVPDPVFVDTIAHAMQHPAPPLHAVKSIFEKVFDVAVVAAIGGVIGAFTKGAGAYLWDVVKVKIKGRGKDGGLD